MSDDVDQHLEISNGYRTSRLSTTLICGLAIGWSAALFDLDSLNFIFAGRVEIPKVSISVILACAVAYMFARCMIEYAMQRNEVRRWSLAKLDFRILFFLVQAALVLLAASGLHRSLDTILYAALGALALIVSVLALETIGTILMMFMLMSVKTWRRRRVPPASATAFEATVWARGFSLVIVPIGLIIFGIAALEYQPIRSLWTEPPSALALGVFVAASGLAAISVRLRDAWESRLYADPLPYTEERLPDGSIRRTYKPG